MAGSGAFTVRVEGYRELSSAFQRMDKRLAKELRTEMRDNIAAPIAERARARARALGLFRSGKLIRGIKPFATGRAVGIKDSVTRKGGFSYPAYYEDGPGDKPFLWPTALQERPHVERSFADFLDRFTSAEGF